MKLINVKEKWWDLWNLNPRVRLASKSVLITYVFSVLSNIYHVCALLSRRLTLKVKPSQAELRFLV